MVARQSPRVSFGLPVRNGEESIAKCLDSILAQDFADFEVVICDNVSTDRTHEILAQYAAKDNRIRVHFNEENVGLVANFNRVARFARGTYFRWIGADDWLEPGYTSACVEALDRDPDAVLATTFFGLHCDIGESEFAEYQGEYPTSDDPVRRIARLFYFFHAGVAVYEPSYSMMRRDVLNETQLFQLHRHQDWLLTVELGLVGPFAHVPECLFHRNWPEVTSSGHYAHLIEMHPELTKVLQPSPWRLMSALNRLVAQADGLTALQRLRCNLHILVFCLSRATRRARAHVRKFRREELGLTRAALRARKGIS